MNGAFDDGYTRFLLAKINDWGLERIYEIEDDIETLEENSAAIVDYLRDICCSMPLGLALRRYLCGKFGKKLEQGGFSFTLSDGSEVVTGDYMREGYDIVGEDIAPYTAVFLDINERYNRDKSGKCALSFTAAEARRMLRVTTVCLRSKMLLISFALHMNSNETRKFLTDVLAEQSYNYRSPHEIIALYCQSHEEVNSYVHYLRLCAEFDQKAQGTEVNEADARNDYSLFAKTSMSQEIATEEELMQFLLANRANFSGYSRTAYSEFMQLVKKAFALTTWQTLGNDDYLSEADAATRRQLHEHVERVNSAIEIRQVVNTEQLAREMLSFVHRYTYTHEKKDGSIASSGEFIPIYNGEGGNAKSKKRVTTALPKEITSNLLVKDRLDDLIRQDKPVERKDLVFLRFYVFSQELIERGGSYTVQDYHTFTDECNDMLTRCGMSHLYPANRFENLVMLSLLSSNPLEMFDMILDYSFMNDPEAQG